MRLITFFVFAVCAFAPIRYVDHGSSSRPDMMVVKILLDTIRFMI